MPINRLPILIEPPGVNELSTGAGVDPSLAEHACISATAARFAAWS